MQLQGSTRAGKKHEGEWMGMQVGREVPRPFSGSANPAGLVGVGYFMVWRGGGRGEDAQHGKFPYHGRPSALAVCCMTSALALRVTEAHPGAAQQ